MGGAESIIDRLSDHVFPAGLPGGICDGDPAGVVAVPAMDQDDSVNLAVMQQDAGLTAADLVKLQRNAIDISWAPPAVKHDFRNRLAAAL